MDNPVMNAKHTAQFFFQFSIRLKSELLLEENQASENNVNKMYTFLKNRQTDIIYRWFIYN